MANKLISELVLKASGDVDGGDWLEIQDLAELTTKKVTVTVLNEIEAAARAAQDDVIEAGVGLNADGTYDQPTTTTYLNASTDVMDALGILDSHIADIQQCIVCDEVLVSTANVIAAGGIPFEIVAAQGANTIVSLISVSCRNDFDSVAFEVAAQDMVLEYDTGASHIMEWSNAFVESGAEAIAMGTWTSNVTQIENKKIQMTFSASGNPSAGDGALTFFVVYRVLDWNVV